MWHGVSMWHRVGVCGMGWVLWHGAGVLNIIL